MSSGALLLQQLQARRRRLQQQQHAAPDSVNSAGRDDENEAPLDIPRILPATVVPALGSSDPAGKLSPSIDDTGARSWPRHEARVEEQAPSDFEEAGGSGSGGRVTIEVCLGPDCSGGGGGAALLEIEELVARSLGGGTSATTVRAIGGGCRDFCTVGPNVHVRGGETSSDAHFCKVDCPSVCRTVFQAAVAAAGITVDGEDGDSSPTAASAAVSSADKILMLREDERRWRALRERAAKERRLRVRERLPALV